MPPARRAEGYDRLCGDEVVVYVDIEGGRLNDVRISGEGCSISVASGSVMSTLVKGRTIEEARGLIGAFSDIVSSDEHHVRRDGAHTGDDRETTTTLGRDALRDLEAFETVVSFPSRIKCAALPWGTLQLVLDDDPRPPS